MGRYKKRSVRAARRGTKRNPFQVGERVRHRQTKARCKVLEVAGDQVGDPIGLSLGTIPIMYRVEWSNGRRDEHWYTSRELEVIS